MTQEVKKVLEQVKAEELGKEGTYEGWTWDFGSGHKYPIAFSTFRRYATLERVEKQEVLSLEEVVQMLNDSYESSDRFAIVDGQVVERWHVYKLTDLKTE